MDLVLLKEMTRLIPVRENDQVVMLPAMQGVLRSMIVSALKGSAKTQVALTHLYLGEQGKWTDLLSKLYRADVQYKKGWEQEIDYCKLNGLPVPEPVPHPTEMIMLQGEVIYNGPETADEKAIWDRMNAERREYLAEAERLQGLVDGADDPDEIRKDIASALKMADDVAGFLPDEESRRKPGFNLQRHRESYPGYAKLMADGRKRRKSKR